MESSGDVGPCKGMTGATRSGLNTTGGDLRMKAGNDTTISRAGFFSGRREFIAKMNAVKRARCRRSTALAEPSLRSWGSVITCDIRYASSSAVPEYPGGLPGRN